MNTILVVNDCAETGSFCCPFSGVAFICVAFLSLADAVWKGLGVRQPGLLNPMRLVCALFCSSTWMMERFPEGDMNGAPPDSLSTHGASGSAPSLSSLSTKAVSTRRIASASAVSPSALPALTSQPATPQIMRENMLEAPT